MKVIIFLLIVGVIFSLSAHEKSHKPTLKQKSSGHMVHMLDVKKWLKSELGFKYHKSVPSPTKSQLKVGIKVYNKNCVICHGKEGKGDGQLATKLTSRPADFTDKHHASFYSDYGRIHIIKKGIKNTQMAGWESSLSEKEIFSVFLYINSLKMEK